MLNKLTKYMNSLIYHVLQADAISTLEKENDFREEHFDFIQMHIRNFCLNCILNWK